MVALRITFWGFAFVFCLLECSKLAPMLKAKNDAKPVLYEGGISRTTLSSKHVKRKKMSVGNLKNE
jgi:hypothetical protein